MRTTVGTTQPEPLERLGADLRRAAIARAASRERRRRRIQAGVAVAFAAALMTGIGLAASGIDVLSWARSDNPGEAHFGVDRGAVYTGAVPRRLACRNVSGETFSCTVAHVRAPRVYRFLTRAAAPSEPPFSRASLLRLVDRAEKRGGLSPAKAERFRRDIGAVDDEFLNVLNELAVFQTIGAGVGTSARGTIVPPRGVPMLVFCDSVSSGRATCHPLSGATKVPNRAPLYELQPSRDWVRAKPGATEVGSSGADLEAILGRSLTPAEVRLIEDLAEPGSAGGAGEGLPGEEDASGGGAASSDAGGGSGP